MKRFISVMAMGLVAVASLIACSEGTEKPIPPASKLTVETSKTNIQSDGLDSAVLTVKYEGNVVTDGIVYYVNTKETDLKGKFATATAGTYKIQVKRNGESSNEIMITAYSGKRFVQNATLYYMTNTGCNNCPTVASAYKKAKEVYGDRLMCMSPHSTKMETPPLDPFIHVDRFNPSAIEVWVGGIGGLPAALIDATSKYQFYPGSLLSPDEFHKPLNEHPYGGMVGIRIESVRNGKTISGKVYVKNMDPVIAGTKIGLALWVTEDNLVAAQLRADGTIDYEYVHNNVVRHSFTMNEGQTKIAVDIPTLSVDGEWTYEFSYTAPEAGEFVPNEYNTANMKIQANVMLMAGGSGADMVINCREVKAGESQADYQYVN